MNLFKNQTELYNFHQSPITKAPYPKKIPFPYYERRKQCMYPVSWHCIYARRGTPLFRRCNSSTGAFVLENNKKTYTHVPITAEVPEWKKSKYNRAI